MTVYTFTNNGVMCKDAYTSLKQCCRVARVSYATASAKGKRCWARQSETITIHELNVFKIVGRGVKKKNSGK
jgi:hypothetical protein